MTIISYSKNFIFVKTNKTAGTTLELGLSQFCNSQDVIGTIYPKDENVRKELGFKGPQNYRKKGKIINKGFFLGPLAFLIDKFGFSKQFNLITKPRFFNKFFKEDIMFQEHCSISHIQKKIDKKFFNNSFKFTIVRNPYNQIVSLYNWDLYRNNLDKNLSFKEFVENYAGWFFIKEKNLLLDLEKKLNFDLVIKYENLDKDLENLTNTIDLKKLKPVLSKFRLKKIGAKPKIFLDIKSIKIINKHAEFFFENFGYKKTNKEFFI